MSVRRSRFIVRGQVQGVGFRPFVFTLAEEFGLSGLVRNSPRGVVIETQGEDEAVAAFARALEERLPPLARVTAVEREEREPLPDEEGFTIAFSTAADSHAVLISPDICTCGDCLGDIANPANRRFRYAFTNCTNCGPRYTITRSIPYDRASTSMSCFPMCPECLAEYENPRDRRFHAQPNACPVCGPEVRFVRAGERPEEGPRGDEALAALAAFLFSGGIAAVKGLGGFHLACDACDEAAVALLRRRKHRPHKPFAVMAADVDEIRRFALVGKEEEALLRSPERPIVLCRALPEAALAPGISPDTAAVGVMLPYTPLHVVLFALLSERIAQAGTARPAALVMTSGNPGGEPICLGNREALAQLGGMADAFLFHNRDILIRVDDSVVRHLPGHGPLYYRRARGYVPRPLTLAAPADTGGAAEKKAAEPAACVLGVGAELKNTLCLTKDGDAFVSQHIGDMANLETAAFHGEIREHLADLLKVRPKLVVRDAHPDYLAGRMAVEFAAEAGVPLLSLQHHAAHAFAVLAEHRFQGRALVLALDGTGFGADGTLWGGEILLADTNPEDGGSGWSRLGHLRPLDLPGGEAAIREPWRIAHALLLRLGREGGAGESPRMFPWLPEHAAAAALLPRMLERGLNTPRSSSCGRLFDGVSALLGLCFATTYEGQAAIRLEEAQRLRPGELPGADEALYPCPAARDPSSRHLLLDSLALVAALAEDLERGTEATLLARRFHASLAAALADAAAVLARERGIRHVGLSGGCLQNVTLALLLAGRLEDAGLTPLLHRELPPGDGCISLGQAAWGLRRLRAGLEPVRA